MNAVNCTIAMQIMRICHLSFNGFSFDFKHFNDVNGKMVLIDCHSESLFLPKITLYDVFADAAIFTINSITKMQKAQFGVHSATLT